MAAWGQGGEFNPSNPAEPGQMYFLTVNVTPEGAGSVSPAGKNQYALGQRIDLWASATTNYRFVGWRQGTAPVSDLASFSYTIPAAHTTLTAVFEYVPGNPEEPSPVPLQHTLFLSASPAEGGRFNVSSGSLFKEGDVIGLQAYLNSGYEFEGWKRGDEIVSTNPSYSVTMGTEDISLVGLFRFNPGSPSNPGANHWDAVSGEVIVDDFAAGNLMGAIDDVIGGSGNRDKVVAITVAGAVSSGDLGVVRYYSACMSLDLKRISGISFLSSYAFDGSQLQKISLPAEITSIGAYAFRNCTNLSEINCYSMVPPVLEQNVFEGTGENVVLRVPQAAIPLYSAAAQWNQLTILPLMEEIGALSVTLPETASDGRYKNMTLELVNTKSAQKLRFVITDKLKYVFGGLIVGDVYNLYLKNTGGVILGEVRELAVTEEGTDAVFNSILSLYDLSLKVVTERKEDVSNRVVVKWYDADNKYLSQGNVLKQQLAGNKVRYTIELDRVLGSKYLFPESKEHTVSEKGNTLVYTLQSIDSLDIQGIVKGDDGSLISGAVVSVSQLLNGKYSRSVIGKTDKNGKFVLNVYNDASTITISANGYINQTISYESFNGNTDLGVVKLSVISGVTITTNFTYTSSVPVGEIPQKQTGYSNYQNVSYTLYNKTKKKVVKDFSVQYPSIILMEPTDVGDEIQITASSRVNEFEPIQCTVIIDTDNNATAQLDIIQLGAVEVSYDNCENTTNVAILYDSNGQRLRTIIYQNKIASFPELKAGIYTVVTMADNRLFNSVLNLSELVKTGLIENVDFKKQEVKIVSGFITSIVFSDIPGLDVTKWSYTDDNTYFRANKSAIVAGNYLTLNANISFKSDYQNLIKNVKLVVDIPKDCSFVDNSIMVGTGAPTSYTFNDKEIIISLDNYDQLVRFCIIPIAGGHFAPNAFVEFELEGERIKQPIGVVNITTEDLSITVPSVTARKQITVQGISPGKSKIVVYDNGIMIGETEANAGGQWSLYCNLCNTHTYSYHNIYAQVYTKQGNMITSESKKLIYDQDDVEIAKVTMVNVAHPANSLNLCEYVTVYDFLDPAKSVETYWYWPNYPDFTFKVEFVNGDSNSLSDVTVYVETLDEQIVPVKTSFDSEKKAWVGTCPFNSQNLPIGMSVSYNNQISPIIKMDSSLIEEYNDRLSDFDVNAFFADANLISENFSLTVDTVSNSYEGDIGEFVRRFTYIDNLDVYQSFVLYNSFTSKSLSLNEIKEMLASYIAVKTTDGKLFYVRYINEEQRLGVECIDVENLRHLSILFYYADPLTRSIVGNVATGVGIVAGIAGLVVTAPAWGTGLAITGLVAGVIATVDGFNETRNTKKRLSENMECLQSKGKFDDLYNRYQNASGASAFSNIFGTSSSKYGAILSSVGMGASNLAKGFGVASLLFAVPGVVSGISLDKINDEIKNECEPDPKKKPIPFKPKPVLDPSGYVYEAVPSNRLQGVTTTVYQKTYEEDMYGDLHEKIELWNAKDYAQENPLTTDENGMYAWDVPVGQWQVKYEKEGYQTAYSEWLPVPPPQLDVNIGLVQNAQPYVAAVHGYETGIEIEFSKFMQPATVTAEQILVTRNGVAENGEVQLLNTEPDPLKGNEMFASKVRFIPEQPFTITDKVILTVSRRAKSYAGINMENDFNQEVTIEKEAKSIVTAPSLEVVYNRVAEVTVAVEPVEAAANKKITALSASPSIATFATSEAVLDENGEATFTVRGELLGSTVLQFAVEGMDLRTEVKVKVVEKGEGEVIRSYHLAMGWNWISANVADQRLDDVVALLEPIKESVVAIKGQSGELTKDDQGNWQGDLSLLHPTRSYKIEMLQDDDLELKGKPVLPADATITLNKGWNWIGYISAEEVSVESALQNLTAEENDVIKGLDCFAVYNGTTWAGSLTHLVPGEGYMYYSQSVKSFNYVEPETKDVTPDAFSPQWKYDARQYADNMTVLARLYNGEQQVEADKYLIGAFSGNECRGVAVEKEGHIFLTVHGEQTGEQISLRAFDVASGKEYMIKEELDFSSDVMKGSYASPESLHLGDPTGIHNIGTGMFIYPNPVRDRLYVRGEVDNIEDIRVVSTAGQTCIVTDRLSAEEGIDVSSLSKGIYFIVVKSVTDEIRQKFIKIE